MSGAAGGIGGAGGIAGSSIFMVLNKATGLNIGMLSTGGAPGSTYYSTAVQSTPGGTGYGGGAGGRYGDGGGGGGGITAGGGGSGSTRPTANGGGGGSGTTFIYCNETVNPDWIGVTA